MIEQEYEIGLNTPAFAGNANQSGQFRTPPFKHLIRQWWRILKAKDFAYDYHAIREAEGRLFGHADLKHQGKSWAMKSQLRISLSEWKKAQDSKPWKGNGIKSVQTSANANKINTALYLGYGPIDTKSKKPLKPWLDDEDSTRLCLQSRSDDFSRQDMDNLFYLVNWLGTVGSRSGNGWGSLFVDGVEVENHLGLLNRISRPFEDCMKRDIGWGHAIGIIDGKKTLWETSLCDDWQSAIQALGEIKAAIRLLAKRKSTSSSSKQKFSYIHLLGLPTGGPWQLKNTLQDLRWPSQLKMKVMYSSEGYQGVIYQLPHAIPRAIRNQLNFAPDFSPDNQLEFWHEIHHKIDTMTEYRYD